MDRNETILGVVIALCVGAVLVTVAVGARGCQAHSEDHRKDMFVECIKAGKEPLACKAAANP